MQSVTSIAPAIAGMFTVPFIVLNAGISRAVAYLGAFIIALLLGYMLAQFSKHLSSTGSYYTFVSRSIGGRWGFLVAWVYLLFYPVVIAQVGSFMGSTLQSALKAEYNITFQWWWFMIFLIRSSAWTAWRGVELSVSLLIVLGVSRGPDRRRAGDHRIRQPRRGGVNFDWLSTPSTTHCTACSSESCSRSSRSPAGTPPRRWPRRAATRSGRSRAPCWARSSSWASSWCLVSWGQISGWGTDKLAAPRRRRPSRARPAACVRSRAAVLGRGLVIVLFALFNSAIAVSIACTNASTRFLYGMARAKALPSWLLKVRPKSQTPTNAVITCRPASTSCSA